jgi:hypothetical protein
MPCWASIHARAIALFKGFSQIMMAFAVRHAGKEAAAGIPP